VAPFGYAERSAEPVRVVAVGYDLSSESEAAVDLAAELAAAAEGTIRILTVDEPRSARYADLMAGSAGVPYEDSRDRLRARVMKRRDDLPRALRADARIRSGFPVTELIDELEQGVDLLVIGSRGYGPIGRALVGSVAADVIRAAPCPVVLVPRALVVHEPAVRASENADSAPEEARSVT
jgi:nucleotide-binding universal stress UspA family protein